MQQIIIASNIKYILVAGMAFFLIYACNKRQNEPISDKRYTLKDANGYYRIQIVKTSKDSIWYIKNDYSVCSKIYLDSVETPTHYTDLPVKISKNNLNLKK